MLSEVQILQYIFAAVIFLTSLIGSVLPLFIVGPHWISRCEAMTGGVFLGGALAHLLADSFEKLGDYNEETNKPITYPLSPAVCLATFAVLTLVELYTYSEHDAGKDVFAVEDGSSQEELDHSEESISLEDVNDEQKQNDAEKGECDPEKGNDDKDEEKQLVEQEKSKKRYTIHFGKDLKSITGTTIALYVMLCVHSTLTGLSLGIVDNRGSVIGIFAAIVGHKPLECFSLSVIILQNKPSAWFFWFLIILYAFFTPVAAIIGVIIQEEGNALVQTILTALSAGTFFLVGCHEWSEMVAQKNNMSKKEKAWHYAFFIFGLLWMLLIVLVE